MFEDKRENNPLIIAQKHLHEMSLVLQTGNDDFEIAVGFGGSRHYRRHVK